MSIDRPPFLQADDRVRLLQAAGDRPFGEQLLAHLVLDDGLTLAQAVTVRRRDVSDGSVTIETKTGRRETRRLSSTTAELASRVADSRVDGTLVTGRTGRPLSMAAARDILLVLARRSGVPVRSVHQLRADRAVVAAA